MKIKKRLYISLLSGSLLFSILIVSMIWYLLSYRNFILNQILLVIIIVILGMLATIMGIGILSIVIAIIRAKSIPSMESITLLVNEFLFPLTLVTGRLLGIRKEKILQSYIEVNNYLVRAKKLLLKREQVMILVPHCLQNSDCQHKITIDINNCQACGRCKIGELIEFARENHAVLKVATGGTLARKHIQDVHPGGIIAVACENDLSSGIHDSGLIPVIGVLNCRPNGPCYNTDVNLVDVENALRCICKGG